MLPLSAFTPPDERLRVVRKPIDPLTAFQTAERLIHPPRFVDEATSGLTVTMWRATSGVLWARSSKNRPKACSSRGLPVVCAVELRGIAGGGFATSGSGFRRNAACGTARPRALFETPPRRRRCASSSGRRAGAHWPSVSNAEWLAGCPSVGNRHALIVYAKMTTGRLLTASASARASTRSSRSCPPRSRTPSSSSRSLSSLNSFRSSERVAVAADKPLAE